MNSFEKRKNKGDLLQEEFKNFLDENNIPYFLSGYEYLTSGSNAFNKIKTNSDLTSFFIRHYPDMSIVFKDKSILVEIKNSSGIEKEAYKNYLSLHNDLGVVVLLYLKNKKLCLIEQLKFNPMSEYDSISNMTIPVVEGIWKEPRLLEKNDYYKYKDAYSLKGKYTSGCSFAFIDFDNTPFYSREILIKANNS